MSKLSKGVNFANTLEAYEARKSCACDPDCGCSCQKVAYSGQYTTTNNKDAITVGNAPPSKRQLCSIRRVDG